MKDNAHPFELTEEFEMHKCAVFDALRSFLNNRKRINVSADVLPTTYSAWYTPYRLAHCILDHKKDVCCDDNKVLHLHDATAGMSISVHADMPPNSTWDIHIAATIDTTT